MIPITPVIAFLKAHWKYAVAAVLIVAAFGAGRFATPTKVVTQTVTKTEVQFKDRVVTQVVHDQAKTVYIDRVVDRTTKPDGTVTEHVETKTSAASKSETDTTKKEAITENAKSETVTTKTVTADAPRLTVSLLAGYQFGNQGILKGSGVNLIPNAGPLSVGAEIQYRIAGPVQVGAFGLTSGVAGLSVGLTF